MNILTKGLSYFIPPKIFQESNKATANVAARDFLEFLDSNPWRRANVTSDVFENAAERIQQSGAEAMIIPRGANITILKHTHLPETVYPQIYVYGTLKNKSQTLLDNLHILKKGKVVGLPFANKILNDGTLKKLGYAKEVVNWGKLRNAREIDYLSNAFCATGYVKDAKELKNYGELFADEVKTATNSGKLFFQKADKIDNHGGSLSGKSVKTLAKHLGKDGVDKGIYNIGSVGKTTTEQ